MLGGFVFDVAGIAGFADVVTVDTLLTDFFDAVVTEAVDWLMTRYRYFNAGSYASENICRKAAVARSTFVTVM